MGPIIFGVKQAQIALEEFFMNCPCCETESIADIMVLSSYVHFYMIPFFPTDKKANVICKECGLKRYEMTFNQKLIPNYPEIKNDYRHPWFTYSGASIIILIIVAFIIGSTF